MNVLPPPSGGQKNKAAGAQPPPAVLPPFPARRPVSAILGLALAMPSVTARFSGADYYGGMTASLFTGESLGYLLVGLLAFALGVCVTVLCVRLHERERTRAARRSTAMLELWDYLVQFLADGLRLLRRAAEYYRARRQPWFLLTCFYATFALGTLYWSLHLLLRQETPQVFTSPTSRGSRASSFLLALTLTLPTAEERRFRTRLCRLAPVVCLPQFILYVTYGDVLSNVFMCGMTMLLAWCAARCSCGRKRSGGAAAPVLRNGACFRGAGVRACGPPRASG